MPSPRPALAVILAAALALPPALPAVAQTPAAAGAAPAPVLPAISVTAVARQVVRDRIIASGTIAPVERVAVAPRIDGQPIEALHADIGDRVAAGAVLATLSDTALTLQRAQLLASRAAAFAAIAQAEASLVEARASAEEAARVRDRQAELVARGVGAQAAADQAAAAATAAAARVRVVEQTLAAAEAQRALVDAQIAVADLNLERTAVIAPVAGEIIERNATLGAIAGMAGPPMFVIVRDGLLELRADVAEQDVLRLAAGQPATLGLVGIAEPIAGTVRLVEPAVDALTRLGRVRIAIDEPARVRAGLFAKAEVIAAEREALIVPITAVSADAGGATVLRVGTDGRVARIRVVTGIRDGAVVEVREGLTEGDRVVARAGAFVRDGDRINPVLAAN